MQDRLEAALGLGIGKDPFAQPAAVETAVAAQHFGAECLDDLGQCGLPGLDDFASDHVGVDDGHAEGGEESATVVLPLAMPPVSATRKALTSLAAEAAGLGIHEGVDAPERRCVVLVRSNWPDIHQSQT